MEYESSIESSLCSESQMSLSVVSSNSETIVRRLEQLTMKLKSIEVIVYRIGIQSQDETRYIWRRIGSVSQLFTEYRTKVGTCEYQSDNYV